MRYVTVDAILLSAVIVISIIALRHGPSVFSMVWIGVMTVCALWIRVCIGGKNLRIAMNAFKSTGVLGYLVFGGFLFLSVPTVIGYAGGFVSFVDAVSSILTFAISDAAMLFSWARLTGKMKP